LIFNPQLVIIAPLSEHITIQTTKPQDGLTHLLEKEALSMADILVVDDQLFIQSVLQQILLNMGHNVVLAGTGIEALKFCTHTHYDLLILDYRLPDMSGLEIAEYLKNKTHFVLHTTDSHNKELQAKARRAGAMGIIPKVSNIALFSQQVEYYLKAIEK
jgi:CheY-like chemotaxis protein